MIKLENKAQPDVPRVQKLGGDAEAAVKIFINLCMLLLHFYEYIAE